VSRIDGDLVVRRITVLDGKVVIFDVEIEI